MRYQGTAVQIYAMPSPAGPDARFNQRMTQLVSTIGLCALIGFFMFLLFGILSQGL
jgi:hypothetical protein